MNTTYVDAAYKVIAAARSRCVFDDSVGLLDLDDEVEAILAEEIAAAIEKARSDGMAEAY